MQTATIPASLDDALLGQFFEFERLHGIPALVPAFDIFPGKECLRVNVHYPQHPFKFVGCGYDHKTLGFETEEQLRAAIVDYFNRELNLSKKKHRISKEYSTLH